ncbi:MAG: hypothetical protein ACRCUY_03650 [Thermoguttaceae bacterium]
MNHFFSSTFLVLFSLTFIVLTGGCGDKNPGTTPVSVTITQKGSPLVGAIVSIISSDGKGFSGSGTTNASGVCSIKTTDGWKGAFPGEYNVAVMKFDRITIPNPTPDSPDGTRSEQRNLLPEKYKTHSDSGFKLSVGNKSVAASFDLTE